MPIHHVSISGRTEQESNHLRYSSRQSECREEIDMKGRSNALLYSLPQSRLWIDVDFAVLPGRRFGGPVSRLGSPQPWNVFEGDVDAPHRPRIVVFTYSIFSSVHGAKASFAGRKSNTRALRETRFAPFAAQKRNPLKSACCKLVEGFPRRMAEHYCALCN